MKIIDNPALGIGVLLCIGIAVFGIAFMTTAEGQYRLNTNMVTSDDGAFDIASMTSSDDFDESPFITREAPSPRPLEVAQADRARGEQARAQDASQQRQQNSMRIENPPVTRPRAENQLDPFAASPREQQRGQQVMNARIETRGQPVAPPRQQVVQAEQRDELLFRIVKLRLHRGEFEQLVPVALQMQNPERVVEMMLDLAEEMASKDEEHFNKLLDVATIVLLQTGQPRPPMPGMMGMPGGMGGGMSGPGMPGMMPMGMGMGMPPGQPMPGQPMMGWSSGGMSSGTGGGMSGPGMPGMMPMGMGMPSGQSMPMGGGMMGPGGMMGGAGMPAPPASGLGTPR